MAKSSGKSVSVRLELTMEEARLLRKLARYDGFSKSSPDLLAEYVASTLRSGLADDLDDEEAMAAAGVNPARFPGCRRRD